MKIVAMIKSILSVVMLTILVDLDVNALSFVLAWLAFKKRTEFSNSKQQLSVQQQQRAAMHSAVYGNFRENIGLLWSE